MARFIQSRVRKDRRLQRKRRHFRVRKKIWGTTERPRLVVFRSSKHLEGQIVNDDESRTLLGLSTRNPEVEEVEVESDQRKVELARAAGKLLAERALEEGVRAVVFDRGGYNYHGRVKAFADGAREGGLQL